MTDSGGAVYAVQGFRVSLDILREVTSFIPIPGLMAVAVSTINIIDTIETIQSNRAECDRVRDTLLQILPVLVALAKDSYSTGDQGRSISSGLINDIDRLQLTLERIQVSVSKVKKESSKRSRVIALLKFRSHADTLRKCQSELDWAMREFEVSTRLVEAVRSTSISKPLQVPLENALLQTLPRAKYASVNSARPDHPGTCMEGTRTEILHSIRDWMSDTDPHAPRLFLLTGIAGTGKTTIAATVAEIADQIGLLGANFFFSQNNADLRNPILVFPTIAYQLARFDSAFNRAITETLEKDPDVPFASLKRQLDQLIIRPLASLKRDLGRPVVIVLDAFDECETPGAREVLELLVASLSDLPPFVKIIMTTRPERFIISTLSRSHGFNFKLAALHDIEPYLVQSDISRYVAASLRKLPQDLDMNLSGDWVTKAEIERLASHAEGLFIVAQTMLRFISDSQVCDPRRQLNLLLAEMKKQQSGHHPFASLDMMYTTLLGRAFPPPRSPDIMEELQLVMGSVIILRAPLPQSAIARLTGVSLDRVAGILSSLQGAIDPGSAPDFIPRVYHPSFVDFVTDNTRCTNSQLWINTEKHEERIAQRCLTLLNNVLHKDMLGSMDPALSNEEVVGLRTQISEVLPPELEYSCESWGAHLVSCTHEDVRLLKLLENFTSRTLLPWLESMSWLGRMDVALRCLVATTEWAKASISSATRICDLLEDAHRLLLANFSVVATSAPNLARSVLPFAPRSATLTSQYTDYADHQVVVLHGVEASWSSCLTTLSDTQQNVKVTSASFSPDGTRIVSGSSDTVVRVWDAVTGVIVTRLKGHSKGVLSVAVTPDGSSLVSGSADRTIRVWDAESGTAVATFKGHSGAVKSVALSPDGSRVASGSEDKTVILWDTATGAIISTLRGHADAVTSVSFAPDAIRIASTSRDRTIRLWDTLTGALIGTLKGHTDSVTSVKFSPDGSCLASGSEDRTIRLWDTASATTLTTFSGHSNDVTAVSFSPDQLFILSGSKDQTIRVWDIPSGASKMTLRGHSGSVTSVEFSPDGARIVSASEDSTIRLWDSNITPGDPLERHAGAVASLSFSPDGKLIASGSADGSVKIWKAVDGGVIHTFSGKPIRKGGDQDLEGIEFQEHTERDGRPVTEGTKDPYAGPSNAPSKPVVRCLAFSLDGSLLAAGSDEAISIWDPTTGQDVATLTAGPFIASAIAFSHDGKRVICGSEDGKVHLWDVRSHTLFPMPHVHSDKILTVQFSPDGTRSASASEGGSIIIWDAISDASTSPHLFTLEGHSAPVTSITFSDDGLRLTSISINERCTWDVATGKNLQTETAEDQGFLTTSSHPQFELKGDRLYRRDKTGEKVFICIIPASFKVLMSDSFTTDKSCVALGCEDGRLLVLSVAL